MILSGYNCAKAWQSNSPARLLAAYGEIGDTAGVPSANGAGVALPYTDDDEPNTIRFNPIRRAAASRRAVAVTLASMYDAGSSSEGRTPGVAPRRLKTPAAPRGAARPGTAAGARRARPSRQPV